jgi:serine/threonine-protein kinase
MEPLHAGSYVLEEVIAAGGFGVVHRARHRATALPAAVKVLRSAAAGDPVAAARFEREADVVRSLACPGVCEIFEHGRLADGRPYLAMELLQGESLGDRVAARGRLTVEEAIEILDPLAAALDAAHARGIVHRDVTPANVFLAEGRPAGRVVLLDFGVARLREAAGTLTGSRETVGTLLHAAPEQLVGSRVGPPADVYGLGALAYAMLTGRPPFGRRAGAALRQIRASARPDPPSAAAPIDPRLDAPILRALDRDPAARPRSAGDFVAELRGAARRSSPSPAASPAGSHAREAVAVHADVRAGPGGEDDEATLAALEAALPLVASELAGTGLVPLVETSTRLLLLGPAMDGTARRVLEAAARAYRRFAQASGGGTMLTIAVHAGELRSSAEGMLLPGGLANAVVWVPAVPAGVVASAEARVAAGDTGEAPPAAAGFFWIAR